MKREVWPGGPKLGEVVEAQLRPGPPRAPIAEEQPAALTPGGDDVNLLLLLQ